MQKNLWVISLGGSRIIPDDVDNDFIKKFKKMIDSHPNKKFIVVTGGGTTARKYIEAIKKLGGKTKKQSETGIAITRFHAYLLTKIFGKKANEDLPKNMKEIKQLLKKNQVVFTGALRYSPNQTSDATSAKIANFMDCAFINLTNIRGLYTANPKTNKNAKFIKSITWKKFNDIAKKIKFKAGQHFVLDQTASKIILKHKVVTYIVGSLNAIDKIIKNKGFVGTLIKG